MSPRDRLKNVQEKLVARGVIDIKLDLRCNDETPLSHVMTDVADALEAYLDGKYHPMPSLGDSYGHRV